MKNKFITNSLLAFGAIGVTAILVFALGTVFGFSPQFSFLDSMNQASSPTPMVDPLPNDQTTDTSMEQDTDSSIVLNDTVPENWTTYYDGALKFRMSYPQEWMLTPATSRAGAAAVHSFDVSETPNTGGISVDEIKVEIVFFPLGDERSIEYEDDQIMAERQVQVEIYEATQRELAGNLGGSVATQVDTPRGTYLITAYPRETTYLDEYQRILGTIRLNANPQVTIDEPALGSVVSTPVTLSGSAPGSWFFEGQLSATLYELNGEEIVSIPVTTEDDWMTTEQVSFSEDFAIPSVDTQYGYISINKSNPSGLPENALQFTWPVRFE